MKNYLANKSFSRGIETLGAEASMAFVGNTLHTVPHMLKHADLYDELPEKYRDGAFLDRLHHFIPGWEVSILRPDLYSNGYGFVVDYLAEILRSLRGYDYSDRYKKHFSLHSTITVRDRDGINKTFSGLMKLLFPNGEATKDEICELLKFSVEGRKRVKDQIMFKIDDTFDKVEFSFQDQAGNVHAVKTLEETQYPALYYKALDGTEDAVADIPAATLGANVASTVSEIAGKAPKAQHLRYQENQKGISFDDLFGAYLRGGTKIVVTDPYIRLFYQVRNFMEFLETVVKHKDGDEDVSVHLMTVEDEFKGEQQRENFERMKDECAAVGINLTWEFDATGSIHARHIVVDNGWKILLDRGLDIFQRCELNDALSFSSRLQQHRPCKAFEVTYLRNEG
jgi:ATP-dependent Lon protease